MRWQRFKNHRTPEATPFSWKGLVYWGRRRIMRVEAGIRFGLYA
jgi:hypothetical protein